MTAQNEIAQMSAVDMARRVRDRDVSPVELVEAAIARIEARNRSVNALIFKGYDDARQRARAAEQAVMSGQPLGPLHGVPTAMKDCGDFKPGWPTTFGGVRALKDHIATSWCTYAKRIEKAGAILLGKTNSPALGFRGTCDNYLFGPTRNPFNTAKNSGGSSGGGAAIVADGMVPLAEGTDGGGSIRIPSAWCGVFGYKASFGRVPLPGRPNAFWAIAPFIFEGPISRTVEDAAVAMGALTAHDPRDPFSLEGGVDYLASLRQPLRGWKIGYSHDFGMYPVDPEVVRVIDRAVGAFEEAGAHVEQVTPRMRHSQQELSDLWCRQIGLLNMASLEEYKDRGYDIVKDHPEDLPRQVYHWGEIALAMSPMDMYRDQVMRTTVVDAVEEVLSEYRLLVTPTLACLPVDNRDDGDTVGPSEINGETVDPLIGWCMTYPINFSGHPAASVPAGLSQDGLPVGLQIVGRRYADADVFAASAAFERIRPWKDTYTICESRPLTLA
ncbi:MAG: amidase [Geminicoccaceae bacterium]